MVKRIRLNGGDKPPPKPRRPARYSHGGYKKKYHTVEQVADAIRKSGGLKTRAAKILAQSKGLNPPTGGQIIDLYIRDFPELQKVLDEVREKYLDIAEWKLIKAIKNERRPDHLRAVTFYLRTIGKERGYTLRSELTGKDGRPVEVSSHKLDLSKLSDRDLNELERIYSKAGISEQRPTHGGNGFDPAGESAT